MKIATLLRTGGLFFTLILTLAAQESSPPPRLTASDKAQGWRILFDGKTLDGWRGYRSNKLPPGWQVEEGALTLTTGAGGDLVTVDDFDSFELNFEWRIAAGGSSGVLFHVTEDFKTAEESGPEYHLVDDLRNPDGKDPKTSVGSCYGLYAPLREAAHIAGEWNQASIIVNANHVEYWLNGVEVTVYELDTKDWAAQVAASKFAKMPDFGAIPKGPIVLRAAGARVAFRNLKIRQLP